MEHEADKPGQAIARQCKRLGKAQHTNNAGERRRNKRNKVEGQDKTWKTKPNVHSNSPPSIATCRSTLPTSHACMCKTELLLPLPNPPPTPQSRVRLCALSSVYVQLLRVSFFGLPLRLVRPPEVINTSSQHTNNSCARVRGCMSHACNGHMRSLELTDTRHSHQQNQRTSSQLYLPAMTRHATHHLCSQPVTSSCHDLFHTRAQHYHTIHIAQLQKPNILTPYLEPQQRRVAGARLERSVP